MRWLAAVLALLLLWPAEDGDAFLPLRAGGAGSAVTFTGECDAISTPSDCVTALSVTHAMVSSYTGRLLQLIRVSDLTTLDLGQVGHVVDMSGVGAFCRGAAGTGDLCDYRWVYDQKSLNDLPASQASNAGDATAPACQTSVTFCAPPWAIDPTNGLPIIVTVAPTQMYTISTTGITAHQHPSSLFWYGRNEFTGWETAGPFGISHNLNLPDTPGTSFFVGLVSGSFHSSFCTTTGDICYTTAMEITGDAAFWTTSQQAVFGVNAFDGTVAQGGTNTNKAIVNGTKLWECTPPGCSIGATGFVLDVPTPPAMGIGAGGDNGHNDAAWQEGAVTNTYMSDADAALARTAATNFYTPHGPHPCQGPADLSYYFLNIPARLQTQPLYSSLAAWGLYQMRASNWYSIATLRDATTATQTFAADLTGCNIDPAAATFCAANPPCTVAKLFGQGTYYTALGGNLHDPTFDMTAASIGAEPTVTFNSLNGRPTMHGNGSALLCSGDLSNPLYSGGPMAFETVARRTGALTTAQRAFSSANGNSEIGYSNAADTGAFKYQNTATGTVSDNIWHGLYWETSGTGLASFVDGVAGATAGSGSGQLLGNHVCLFGTFGGTNLMTGDIAEAAIISDKTSGTPGFASQLTAIFAMNQAKWGVLPH